MGKYIKNKGRSKQTFVMMRHDIIDSEAYRSLSAVARCVLLEVARRYNGHNNGDIPLSCREAAQLVSVSKDTAGRAFRELLSVGLLRENGENYFYNINRKSRRWELTYEAYQGRKARNDWKKFKA